jgi:hypothetical protein
MFLMILLNGPQTVVNVTPGYCGPAHNDIDSGLGSPSIRENRLNISLTGLQRKVWTRVRGSDTSGLRRVYHAPMGKNNSPIYNHSHIRSTLNRPTSVDPSSNFSQFFFGVSKTPTNFVVRCTKLITATGIWRRETCVRRPAHGHG